MGLRLWGIAELPFWPLAKNSSTSRCSDFCRPRISVAMRSMEEAMMARVEKYSACKSRGRTWVEISWARMPSLSQTYCSTKGGMLAKFPTAPEIFPASTPLAANSKRSILRFISLYQVASLRPKVVGSAWTPWVRPIMMVILCSLALSPTILVKLARSRRMRSLACL